MASWAPWVSRRRASDLGRRGGSRRRQGMRSRAGGSSGGRGRRRIARRQGCIRSRSCQTSIERMWRRRKGGGRPLADIDTRDGRIGPHAPVAPRDIVRATACLNGAVTTGRTRPGRTDSDLGVGPTGRPVGSAGRARPLPVDGAEGGARASGDAPANGRCGLGHRLAPPRQPGRARASPACGARARRIVPDTDSVQYSVRPSSPPKARLVVDIPAGLRHTTWGSARWLSSHT